MLGVPPLAFVRRDGLGTGGARRVGRGLPFRKRIDLLRYVIDAEFINLLARLRQCHIARRPQAHEPFLAANREPINPAFRVRACRLQIKARAEAVFARLLDRGDIGLRQ